MSSGRDTLVRDLVSSVGAGTAEDATAAARFVVGFVGALLLAVGLTVLMVVVKAVYGVVRGVAGGGLPPVGTVDAVGNAVLWLVVVVGPPLYTARRLVDTDGDRLVTRPGPILVVPVVVLAVGVAFVVTSGKSLAGMGILAAGLFVLVVRTTGHYARDVATLSPSRRTRIAIGTLALAPLSFVATMETLRVIASLTGQGAASVAEGYAGLNDLLASAGLPDGLAVGAATINAFDLVVAGVPLSVCGGYVLVQAGVSLQARTDETAPGRPEDLQEAFDRARRAREKARSKREAGEFEAAVTRIDRARKRYATAAQQAEDAGRPGDRTEATEAIDDLGAELDETLAAAVDERREEMSEYFEEAESHREAGEYDEAADAYERARRAADRALDTYQGLVDVLDAYQWDRDFEESAVVLDLREQRNRIETERGSIEDDRARDHVDALLERAAEARTEADQHREDGDLEAAVTAYGEAADALTEAREIAAEAGLDTVGEIDERLDAVETAREETETERVRATVEDRVETAEAERSAAADARAEGDLEAALSGYKAAHEAFDEAHRMAVEADLQGSYEIRASADEVADTIEDVERDLAAEQVEETLEDVRATIEDAEASREEEAFDRALDAYADALERAEGVRETALQAGRDERKRVDGVIEEIETATDEVARERARTRVQPVREAVADHVEDAREHRESGAYDEAIEAYETALDRCEEALETASDAGLDERRSLRERREEIEDAIDETVRERDLEAARSRIEDGDRRTETAEQQRSTAERAADEGRYEAAADAYGEAVAGFEGAREQYDRAAKTFGTYDAEGYEEASDKRERAGTRRDEARLSRVAQRINAAQSATADDPEAARERFSDIVDDVADLASSIGETADLTMLESEARRGRLRARIAAARESIADAVEAYDDGAYDEALEGFGAAAESLRESQSVAEEHDLADERSEIERLVDLCEDNAEAARRARFGIGDSEPQVRHPSTVAGTDAEETSVAGETPDRSPTASPGAAAATTGVEVDESKFANELPAHERLAELGEGGSATVYRIRLESTGRVVALKEPRGRADATQSPEVLQSFAREATFWSQLSDSPHVVELLDWGLTPGPWMIAEYMEGGSLADRIGDLSVVEAVDALVDVCEAVRYAHQRTGYHTDLKPANVLFTEEGGRERAKVGDWGLAKTPFGDDDDVGGATPAYAAPEQVDPERFGSIGPHTDVYQLGVVTYEAFTGRRPFTGDTVRDVTAAVLDADPPAPTDLDPSLPPALDDVVGTAMAREPGERYDSVVLVRDALESLRG